MVIKPKATSREPQDNLFKRRLIDLIDLKNPLVQLADKIDWEVLNEKAASFFSDVGRPGVPTRFMVGMLILKSLHNLSDEKVFERWIYDPYYQLARICRRNCIGDGS